MQFEDKRFFDSDFSALEKTGGLCPALECPYPFYFVIIFVCENHAVVNVTGFSGGFEPYPAATGPPAVNNEFLRVFGAVPSESYRSFILFLSGFQILYRTDIFYKEKITFYIRFFSIFLSWSN